MHLSRRFAIWLIFFWYCYPAYSQSLNSPQVSLLTCGQGDELYSTFGHSALRVYDPKNGIDEVYNYGSFDFNEPNFYLKFLRGKLPYFLGKSSFNHFLKAYHYEKRWIKEQVLLLDSLETVKLINLLRENAEEPNKYYKYDFFYDNCSSRITDIVSRSTQGPIEWDEIAQEGLTRRQMLHQFLGGMPWSEFGIDLIIGAGADQKVDIMGQMFLPTYLMNHFEGASQTDNGRAIPLVSPSKSILTFDEEDIQRKIPPFFTPHVLFLGLFIALILIWWNYRNETSHRNMVIVKNTIYTALALGSLVMLVMWFLTEHQATNNNWNLIWASPLFTALLWVKKGTKRTVIINLLLLSVSLSLFNVYIQILPQAFSIYNTGLYAIILFLFWKYEKR